MDSNVHLNKVILIGKVTRDPYFDLARKGSPFASCTILTEHSYMDSQGHEQTENTHHTVVFWGDSLIPHVQQHAKLDRLVMIEGRIRNRRITNTQGHEETICEIRADRIVPMLRNV